MRTANRPILGLLGAALLCLPAPGRAGGPRVVATLPDLAALCREIGGERATVSVLLRSSEDPVLFEPQPDEALLLSRADLLVAGGTIEASFLPRLLASSHNPRLREYLDAQRVLEPPGTGYVLGDPRSAARVAQAIAAELGALDPPGAGAYRRAAAALAAEIGARERRWQGQLGPLRGQKVVTYDDSFRPFLAWAGLVEAGTLSPAPGVPPTPTQVSRVLRTMRQGGVRLILQREYEPAHTVRFLQEKTGAQVVVAPLGARAERGERYIEGIEQLVRGLLGAHLAAGERGKAP